MIHHASCPVCESGPVVPALSAKDHTVSSERFFISLCANCTAMFTQDIPSQERIGAYYASDNYVSHSNTQKGLVNRLYHRIRRITLASKRKLVQSQTKRATGEILDVGCGTGAFLNEMRASGWNITGLEPDATARKNAKGLFNIEPQLPDDLFTLPEKKYDAITLWHVLEHVHQLQEYVVRFKELLSPEGVLVIAVPNYTSYDAEVYKEFWAAYDVPRHLYHFSPKSMQVLMDHNGLEVKKMKPMWFDSYYVSMLSEQYRSGKSNMIRAFFIGAISNLKALFDVERCSSVIYVIRKIKN
jgi:2-polyprenyl-3-methyl-5-hydroxy-6-metoxy-1,4-benzoquinol methylase